MTKREELHVVKSTTSVDEALEMLVEHRITGFPVIDDEWNLVSGIILYLNIVFLKHTTIYGEPSY
jgi:CBS domain-containing protein